jgi:hypothetical protein
MKYLILIVVIIGVILYVIYYNQHDPALITPFFRQKDQIIQYDKPDIRIINQSMTHISNTQVEILKRDYLNLWFHLDHLHNTNDIVSGKSYFTEDFFRFLLSNHESALHGNLLRKTYNHDVSIVNFSPDGLICTLTDRNILLKYETPVNFYFDTVNVAMVLLYQGENWRIDALQFF